MLLFIQLLHSCLLRRGKGATCYRYSQALTYSILLSTIFDGPPLSPERERGCILHVCGHWHSYGLMVCEGSEIISSDAVQNGKSPEIINLLLSVIYCKFEPGRDAEVVPE